MAKDKLDINAPNLAGKYIEINSDMTEFAIPPSDFLVISSEESNEDFSMLACNSSGCNNQVKISEEGNNKYAWYFLTNKSDKYAGVTIERRWIYQGKWRKDTVRHRLFPGQHKEVFSFPRNQRPMCCIVNCSLE